MVHQSQTFLEKYLNFFFFTQLYPPSSVGEVCNPLIHIRVAGDICLVGDHAVMQNILQKPNDKPLKLLKRKTVPWLLFCSKNPASEGHGNTWKTNDFFYRLSSCFGEGEIPKALAFGWFGLFKAFGSAIPWLHPAAVKGCWLRPFSSFLAAKAGPPIGI